MNPGQWLLLFWRWATAPVTDTHPPGRRTCRLASNQRTAVLSGRRTARITAARRTAQLT